MFQVFEVPKPKEAGKVGHWRHHSTRMTERGAIWDAVERSRKEDWYLIEVRDTETGRTIVTLHCDTVQLLAEAMLVHQLIGSVT